MRKLAWLTLVAAAVLFFGAPENAFAHGVHHHVQQAQAAPAFDLDVTAPVVDVEHSGQFVSAAVPQSEKCPHGQGADCGFCCACTGSASAAIVSQLPIDRDTRSLDERIPFVSPYHVRQTVLDLSRPPKSFA
jgi:hypothetical protein